LEANGSARDCRDLGHDGRLSPGLVFDLCRASRSFPAMKPAHQRSWSGLVHMRTIEDYREDVARYLREKPEALQQLLLLTINQVEREFGILLANQIIEDFDLHKNYGLQKKRMKD
jgi:hypothetical protein